MFLTTNLLLAIKGQERLKSCVYQFDSKYFRHALKQRKLRTSIVIRYYFKNFQEIVNLQGFLYLEKRMCSVVSMHNNEEELYMNKEEISYGIPLDVSIGQIEVSLHDVLEMKQGSCIIGKLPATDFVTLLIAGEPVANASFEVEGDMVVIKINSILMNDKDFGDDNSIEELVS